MTVQLKLPNDHRRRKKGFSVGMKKTSTCKAAALLLLFSVFNSAFGAEKNVPEALLQTDSKNYLQLGMLALENNDDQAAVEFLTNALNGPQQPHVLRQTIVRLHTSLLRTNKFEQAAKVLLDASKRGEFQDHQYLLELMQCRSDYYQGSYAKALDKSSKLQLPAADKTSCAEQLELQARCCSKLGRHAAARKYFAALDKLAPSQEVRLTALEGILLNSLDLNDTQAAQKAFDKMQQLLTGKRDDETVQHLQKLRFLLACKKSQAADIYEDFKVLAEKSSKPDALISRIAILLTDHFLQQKKFDQAVKCSVTALDFAESSFKRTALKMLIESLTAAGKLTDAKVYITSFCKDYPQDPEFYHMVLLYANLCNQLQQNDEAITTYRKLYENKQAPQNIRFTASLELAKLYQKSNQQQLAVDQFKFAIANAPDKAMQIDLEHRLGEYLYQLGRYAEAVEHFDRAANAQSKRSGLWLAQTYFQLKKYDLADKTLKNFTLHGDADLQRRAAYLQALLVEKLKSSNAAISSYINFVNRYPKSPEAPEALFQAGVLAQKSHRYKAYQIFERYAANYPGDRAANALYKSVNELLALGKYTKAEELWKKLTSTYPDSKFSIAGYFSMISFLRNNNYIPQALRLLQEAANRYQAKNPELIPEILYERALLYNALKDYTQVRSNLDELIKNHTGNKLVAQALYMQGDLFLLNGDYQQALTAFQQAQERSNGGLLAYSCIGRTADTAYALYGTTRQKQYLHQAAECYENLLKVKDLPPEFYFQTLYKLGNCRKDSGNQTDALRCYREVIYRALLAKRQGGFYSQQWSAKALDAALKLLLPAISNAASQDEKNALFNEAEQLLKIAGSLDLRGENIKEKQDALQQLRSR